MATKKKEESGLSVRMSKVKELVVELTDLTREPKFTFNGDWAGKDVRIVLRHITQAYRRNQIAKAKAMAVEQENETQTTGATNE